MPAGFNSAAFESANFDPADLSSADFESGDSNAGGSHPTASNPVTQSSRELLIQQLETELDLCHYSPRTQRAYLCWIFRFLDFAQTESRFELDSLTVEDRRAFLCEWANKNHMSVSTQNQAEAALSLLFRHIPGLSHIRGCRSQPRVLSRSEVGRLLECMSGTPLLMASLLYGAGLRLLECARLRVQDVDLHQQVLCVGLKKASATRVVPIPKDLVEPLGRQLDLARDTYQGDLELGTNSCGLDRPLDEAWLFPAKRTYVCRLTGKVQRHHLHETVLQKAIQQAARATGLEGRATCQSLRRAFASHLREAGCDLAVIQECLGHCQRGPHVAP